MINQTLPSSVSTIPYLSQQHIVTLGCDPEFVIVTQDGRHVPANLIWNHHSQLGSDGPLAELRPTWAYHETDVVENLRKLIYSPQLTSLKQYGISPQAHSTWDGLAIGFHIHMGAPPPVLRKKSIVYKIRNNIASVLDYFVGIPAMLFEDTSLRRLGNGNYGKPGDIRVTQKTIEYRTPGGFYLRHPSYARGLLGLSLAIVKDLFDKMREKSGDWCELKKLTDFNLFQKMYNLPARQEIVQTFSDPTKIRGVFHLSNVLDKLAKTQYISTHLDSIRTLFHMMQSNQKCSPNLLDNW